MKNAGNFINFCKNIKGKTELTTIKFLLTSLSIPIQHQLVMESNILGTLAAKKNW